MSKNKSRGRGRGNISLNFETIGFGRGEQLPTPALQPPPLQPPLRKQPIPLVTGDETNYLLALRKEFIKTMKSSPYFIRAEMEKPDVERYSDKYRITTNVSLTSEWEPDWKRFPRELKISKKRKSSSKLVSPNLSQSRKKNEIEFKKKLDALEKKDIESDGKVDEKEAEDDESDVEEVIGDQEEDEEEENDYLTSYFDNGESYLDEEDDNLEDKDGGIY